MVHTRQMLNKKIREDLQLHKAEVDAVISVIINYINDLPINDKLVAYIEEEQQEPKNR